MSNPYIDGRLESYRQQRMKTPIARKISKEDNVKAFQQLQQLMENRSPSSQSKLQSKALLLKGLISKNGKAIGMQFKTEPSIMENISTHSREGCLDVTADTQAVAVLEPTSTLDKQGLPASRVLAVGGASPLTAKNEKQGKKAQLLKKFDVMEKRQPQHRNLNESRQDRSRSINARLQHQPSMKNLTMQRSNCKQSDRKPQLTKYVDRLQQLKSDLQNSNLLKNPTAITEAFSRLADMLRRQML